MRRLASILVLVACVLVLTLVFATADAPPGPRPISAAALAAFDQGTPVLDEVNAEVERLRSRLATPPKSPVPVRDPFRFGPKLQPTPTLGIAPPPPALTEPAPVVVPVLPRLVAITSSVTDGVIVRTAVLAVGDDVQIVKAGATVAKFLLRSIGTDTAELVDPATGVVYRIR